MSPAWRLLGGFEKPLDWSCRGEGRFGVGGSSSRLRKATAAQAVWTASAEAIPIALIAARTEPGPPACSIPKGSNSFRSGISISRRRSIRRSAKNPLLKKPLDGVCVTFDASCSFDLSGPNPFARALRCGTGCGLSLSGGYRFARVGQFPWAARLLLSAASVLLS
jgi:hypothetical protein